MGVKGLVALLASRKRGASETQERTESRVKGSVIYFFIIRRREGPQGVCLCVCVCVCVCGGGGGGVKAEDGEVNLMTQA